MVAKHHRRSNAEVIQQCNRAVSGRFHMGIRVYKSIKATAQLLAVATGFFAIAQGADPLTTYALVALVVAGPEAVETIIAESAEE
jgi:hypothetical protein